MTYILEGKDPSPDYSIVKMMFTHCNKITDPPANAKGIQTKGIVWRDQRSTILVPSLKSLEMV